jgi:hypothetical protein
MPSFILKVHDGDEGEEFGECSSDYLPRVGEPFQLWIKKLQARKDSPFCGLVTAVTHELLDTGVVTTVWLAEEAGAVTMYCDCTEEAQQRWPSPDENGKCVNCGYERVT